MIWNKNCSIVFAVLILNSYEMKILSHCLLYILGGLAELVTARLQSNCAAVFKFTHELAVLHSWHLSALCAIQRTKCVCRFLFKGELRFH